METGQTLETDDQVQVLGPPVAVAPQGKENLPFKHQGLVAIGQPEEATAPIGPPGDEPEGRPGRGEAKLKGPGGKARLD